ncbi:MAG: preprotein translocase subunit SecY, partial [Patescibacteria group bacterium]|nr:preprotein translocase subunit SecY [Patescibacteria group bacterium]
SIRKRILFVLFILVIFRLLSAVPIPGVDAFRLQGFLQSNQFLGILNVFSGGGLSALSIVMLGVGPYITGSIVMQLMTMMSPRLKSMYHDEGEAGKAKFSQYSRIITIPLALIQGFALLKLLDSQGILEAMSSFDKAVALIVITAGSMFLVWLGELITEKGIGNGVSVIIFAGIVASIPAQINQIAFTFTTAQIPMYAAFLAAIFLIVAGVVLVTEAERLIPITYAKQARAGGSLGQSSSYLPLRINQAGVMPIIFALSILSLPQMLSGFMVASKIGVIASVGEWFVWFAQATVWYSLSYFVLVFLFTYFYTAITFEPESVATNLQKNGAFIPGIRPGLSTTEYISKIVTRITFIGAMFLGLVAVLPFIMQELSGVQTLAIGGTALLIVVSVVLDILKKVDGQISMRQY